MKKSLWIWIPLAAVLLTGCSGNDGADSIAEGMTAMENKDTRRRWKTSRQRRPWEKTMRQPTAAKALLSWGSTVR